MSSNDNELPFWNGYLAVNWIIRAEFVLFLACCLHWTWGRRIVRDFAWTLPCTCLYLHTKPSCFIRLSEVQGVSKILSKAVSCLDKLDWLGRDPQGGVNGRRQESKTGWLVSRKKGEQKKREGGMFANWIAVNYLVSDYIHFKFFCFTWENPLMQNSLPNKVKDKSSYFLIHITWIYCCHPTCFSRAPQEWDMVFWFSRNYLYILNNLQAFKQIHSEITL